MAGISVPIEFIAQFGKSLEGLNQFAQQAGEKVDAIESKFSGLTTVLGAVAGYFAVGKIIDGLERVTEEASQTEKATNSMVMALKSAGDYSEQNAATFKKLADELARTSRFDDDLILSQVRLAKQFNTTNKEASRLISAAVDLAAATGEDLPTAVQQLGQTLDGTVGRVGQLIPSLQNLTAEQLRAGAAIDVVAKRFQGFAQGELQTFDGAVIQAGKSFNDFLKAIGASIVQNKTVVELFNQLGAIVGEFTEFIKENKGALTDLVSGGIQLAVNSLGIFVQALGILDRAISDILAALEALGKGLYAIVKPALGLGSVTNVFKELKAAFTGYQSDLGSAKARSGVYDEITDKIAKVSVALERATGKNKEIAATTDAVAAGFDKQAASAKRFDQNIKTNFESLKKELESVGQTQLQTLDNTYKKHIKLLDDSKKIGFIKDQERVALLGKLQLKYEQDAAKLRQESYDKLVSQVNQLSKNPFSRIPGVNEVLPEGGSLGLSRDASLAGARTGGVINSVLNGAEGAKQLIGSAASAAGVALFGPAGEILGPIAQQLSQGPEKVKQMVTEFAKAIPDLVKNIIEAIPVVIEVLAEKLPDIIDALIDKLPEIVEHLIKALPRITVAFIAMIPRIIAALVAGTARMNGKLLEGAGKFVLKILEGALRFVGTIIEGAGKFVGALIKSITPGKNGTFFNMSGGGFGLGGDKGLLGGGLIRGVLKASNEPAAQQVQQSRPSGPNMIQIALNVGQRELANTIVDLKRLGYRLEPI